MKDENTNAVIITEKTDDIDVLDRQVFIDRIKQIIEYYAEKKQSASFSIQGSWGSGKTWIINKIYNELYDIQDFENLGSKYCIFAYNAWDYDYYDEPLISLIISLYKQLNNENAVLIKNEETRKQVKAFFEALKDDFIRDLEPIPFIGNIISFKQNYDKKLEGYDDKIRKYDFHFDINQIMEATLKGFNKLSENKTLVLFIDELDRCLPEYAIKVLERIHHIRQYVKNIEIVYSIDKSQLQKTISNFFDKGSVNNYLSKFIEFGITMPPTTFNAEIEKKYSELFEQFDFINCSETTEIIELIKSLLPETIPIRIHQAILKKIVFINAQLNKRSEKLDYSILIAELFISIAEEVNMKWDGSYLDFDKKRQIAMLRNRQLQYNIPSEIAGFILKIADANIYKVNIYEEKTLYLEIGNTNPSIHSLGLYYIARLIRDTQYFSVIHLEYLEKNDEYLKNFFDYYKSLEM